MIKFEINFQPHYSSLQCQMILQKSLKYANLMLKKHIIISVKNSLTA